MASTNAMPYDLPCGMLHDLPRGMPHGMPHWCICLMFAEPERPRPPPMPQILAISDSTVTLLCVLKDTISNNGSIRLQQKQKSRQVSASIQDIDSQWADSDIRYTTELQRDGVMSDAESPLGSQRIAIVVNYLQPRTGYWFKASYHNQRFGLSDFSEPTPLVTTSGRQPGVPWAVRPLLASEDSINITWRAPVDTGGYDAATLEYDVQYIRVPPIHHADWTSAAGVHENCRMCIDGLDGGSSYSFRVAGPAYIVMAYIAMAHHIPFVFGSDQPFRNKCVLFSHDYSSHKNLQADGTIDPQSNASQPISHISTIDSRSITNWRQSCCRVPD